MQISTVLSPGVEVYQNILLSLKHRYTLIISFKIYAPKIM